MSGQTERIHLERKFNGEDEDVFITIKEKTLDRFEAWVEVRGVEKYCGVFKNQQRADIATLLTPQMEYCYKLAMIIVSEEYWG
jgi:hypothetical protein